MVWTKFIESKIVNRQGYFAKGLLLSLLLLATYACSPEQGEVGPELVSTAVETPGEVQAFPGWQGPESITRLPSPAAATPLSTYMQGSADALGLFVLDESASWLGLVHGLKSIGVPVRVVSDLDQALEHDVLMIYPMLTGSNMEPTGLRRLAEFVRSGKTLLAYSVIGGGMPDLFGFASTVEHADRLEVRFQESALTEYFLLEPEEGTLRLAPLQLSSNVATAGMPGVSYSEPRRDPIAVYADGRAAITQNYFAAENGRTGYAYAIGLDFGHFILRAHNGRFSGYTTHYVNAYQPVVDTLLRFFATVYRQGEQDAVLLSPVPQGRDLAVLITHDIDFTQSLDNASAYALAEQNQSVPATYFVQTKYVRDYNDDLFFDESRIPFLQELVGPDLELASHSVAHSNEFRFMPLGTGREQYPDYQPFVQNFSTVNNASILGELRISKFLLESASNQQIRAFRPGHLSLPENLPELLLASGYEFSSSITANEALTHLPYRLNYSRAYATELDVFEFPVTFEDEQWALPDSLDQVLEVTNKIARHGGLINLLIHTETTTEKNRFQNAYVEAIRESSHFSTMSEFGDWWKARESVRLSRISQDENVREFSISVSSPISGLTLELPDSWQYEEGLDGSVQRENKLILGDLENFAHLRFATTDD